MLGAAARTALVLAFAGLALAFSFQGAAARGGSGGVTVIVSGDGWNSQRAMNTRHSHRQGHQWRNQSRPALKNPAIRAFHRSAPHRFSFESHRARAFHKPPDHVHSKHSFHKPSHHAHSGHGFNGPRIIVVEPSGTRRTTAPGVVVLRGGSSAVGVLGGGKVIVLSPSPSFKHIVVGK